MGLKTWHQYLNENKVGNQNLNNLPIYDYDENNPITNPKRIAEICDHFEIKNYKIDKNKLGDWVVNVKGDVDLSGQDLKRIPVIFGEVKGDFIVDNNPNLISLYNCPASCYNFSCKNCSLNSLVGGPIEFIGESSIWKMKTPNEKLGTYDCSGNRLKELKYLPTMINNLICFDNKVEFTIADVPTQESYEIKGEFSSGGRPLKRYTNEGHSVSQINFFNSKKVERLPGKRR